MQRNNNKKIFLKQFRLQYGQGIEMQLPEGINWQETFTIIIVRSINLS